MLRDLHEKCLIRPIKESRLPRCNIDSAESFVAME